MKHFSLSLLAFLVLGLCSSRITLAEEEGEKIALDKVPAEVKAAAEKAVPGITLTEAEKETKKGVVVYELDGTANGKKYEIKVDASGKVLKSGEDKEDDKDEDKKEGKKHKKHEKSESGEKKEKF